MGHATWSATPGEDRRAQYRLSWPSAGGRALRNVTRLHHVRTVYGDSRPLAGIAPVTHADRRQPPSTPGEHRRAQPCEPDGTSKISAM